MRVKNLNKSFQTLAKEDQPSPAPAIKQWKVNAVVFLIAMVVMYFCMRHSESEGAHSSGGNGIDYELLVSNNSSAIVLLKEPLTVDLSRSKLGEIADSLYQKRIPSDEKLSDSYLVWFYYRRDWKGHSYYAGKVWTYDIHQQAMTADPIDVTGITGNDVEDDRSSRRRHEAQ